MTTAREKHEEAMRLVDDSNRAKARGDETGYQESLHVALDLEIAAIECLSNQHGLAWSILHRSAATIALDCKEYRLSEKLASKALSGDAHPEIINELRDVWQQAYYHLHQSSLGYLASDTQLLLDLAGKQAAGGWAHALELTQRIDSLHKLVLRIAQRRLFPRYSSRVPSAVRAGFNVFASVPSIGDFSVALKLGHLENQAALPGMLGIDDVVVEFLDLLELANNSRRDELTERIPDNNYMQNFVGLGRKLAPDGNRIRQVDFALVNGRIKRSLSVTTPAANFMPHTPTTTDIGSAVREVSGILKYADARSSGAHRIRLEPVNGDTHFVSVPAGMMDDIVRPMWNSHVTVRGATPRRGNVLRLYEIWESDPETGTPHDSGTSLAYRSGGLQHSFIPSNGISDK